MLQLVGTVPWLLGEVRGPGARIWQRKSEVQIPESSFLAGLVLDYADDGGGGRGAKGRWMWLAADGSCDAGSWRSQMQR